jgi:hypothetical protein
MRKYKNKKLINVTKDPLITKMEELLKTETEKAIETLTAADPDWEWQTVEKMQGYIAGLEFMQKALFEMSYYQGEGACDALDVVLNAVKEARK